MKTPSMQKAALLGGEPVRSKSPGYFPWPVGGEQEKEALRRVLHSGTWGTLGKECAEFAARYAEFCQAKHALPVINGSTAIELILRGLGIGYGDEVIVPPYTFTASVHAIVLTGAKPVFADIELDTFCLSATAVEKAITPRTRAILGVHIGGRPFDFAALSAVADKHGIPLIEDAAQAHGSEWKNRRVGSLGVAAAFSFQQSKNLSGGEGGAITTNDDELYQRLWSIHHNGRSQNLADMTSTCLGTNARLAEWQCAILLAQMKNVDAYSEARTRTAARLDEALGKMPFISVMKKDERITRNSYHLYCFRYHAEALGNLPRSVFLRAVQAENVAIISAGYCQPIYEMGILYSDDFKRMTGSTFENPKERLPNNETIAYKEGCWMYQSSLLGTDADTDKIIQAFAKVADNAEELKHTFA
ncbi:MAG: DegT/DnrJ/EryC1/StrS family aminotransferase [Lentisphaeria bacterium]|jgi:perosamine synthetase